MAQILRLRGPEQLYSARGWSLFRLANHRLQRQQLLAFASAPPITQDQEDLLSSLAPDTPSNRITHDNFAISKICARARELNAKLAASSSLSDVETIALIKEMHQLDHTTTSWRAGPNWKFKTLRRAEIPNCPGNFPDFVELHADAWIAYEWNYHRTGRIILHTHLLEALSRLLESLSLASSQYSTPPNAESETDPLSFFELQKTFFRSKGTISVLANQILATVPQSLGDIDAVGNLLTVPAAAPDSGEEVLEEKKTVQGVGAYFLLWPIKVLKGHEHVHEGDREMATRVFERIREVTGMKGALGERSCI